MTRWGTSRPIAGKGYKNSMYTNDKSTCDIEIVSK